jgi:hypothetical protein
VVSERRIVIAATIATAVTRLLALSKTLWDWDEALFVLALRDFDVTLHHPHPPGFPLYVLSAKLFALFSLPEFRALQAVNLIAAIAIVPAAYLLGRALRFTFATSLIAALFLAFFPNVWFFGGTAFSDVSSMVLVVLGSALFLRGNPLAGAIVLGIAVGFRPQNLLVGALPLLLARSRVRSIAIVGTITAVSYLAAAQASGGWSKYAAAVSAHQKYIATHDSIGAATRPPIRFLIDDFFFWPFRAPAINVVFAVLILLSVIAAVVRPQFGRWVTIGTFAPLAVLSFLMLDWLSASRFAIAYMPLFAILAADGLELAARRFHVVASAGILVMMFIWPLSLLREVREHPSPPAAAIASIPPNARLFVAGSLEPHARALLRGRPFEVIDQDAVPLSKIAQRDAIVLREGGSQFVRNRDPLAKVARDRYFDVSAGPMANYIRIDGKSVLLGPADGIARFSIALRGSTTVTVRFNNRVVDTFSLNGSARTTYRLPSRVGVNRVTIDGDAEIVSVGWVEAARF